MVSPPAVLAGFLRSWQVKSVVPGCYIHFSYLGEGNFSVMDGGVAEVFGKDSPELAAFVKDHVDEGDRHLTLLLVKAAPAAEPAPKPRASLTVRSNSTHSITFNTNDGVTFHVYNGVGAFCLTKDDNLLAELLRQVHSDHRDRALGFVEDPFHENKHPDE